MLPLKDIPDVNAETMIPHKRMRLSTFARLTWTLMALIVLSVTWLIVSKFDFDRLRGANHFMDQAREAVTKKDWATALSAIRKVDGSAREEPKFQRIVADYLIETQSEPDLLAQTLQKLQGTSSKRPDDAVWLTRSYIATDRTALARKTFESVASDQRQKLISMDTEVALLRTEGRTREAVVVENQMFALYGDDPGIGVRKSARDMSGTFPEIRQSAIERLWRLAERTDEHGLASIRVLARNRALNTLEASRLQKLAEAHPSTPNADRLAIASILLRLHPEDRETILRSEIQRMKDAGGASLQQLIEWLAGEKAFSEVVKLVPKESLLRSVELFPALAQDLAHRGRWDELMKLVEQDEGKPLPISNGMAASWRALAMHNLHPENLSAVRAHLEEAIAEGLAKDDGHALLAALTLAEEWNMLDLALEATLRLAADSPNESRLLEKCWSLAFRAKKMDVLIEIAMRQSRLKPGNVLLTRRLDYLRLLRGESMELSFANEAASKPQAVESSTTLLVQALKAYRLGNLQQAGMCVGRIQNAEEMTAGESAVYAGLLVKTRGETARAFQLAEKIHIELLLAEEQTFLEMAL